MQRDKEQEEQARLVYESPTAKKKSEAAKSFFQDDTGLCVYVWVCTRGRVCVYEYVRERVCPCVYVCVYV